MRLRTKILACILVVATLTMSWEHYDLRTKSHAQEKTEVKKNQRVDYDNNNHMLKEADIDLLLNSSFKVNAKADLHIVNNSWGTEVTYDRVIQGSGSATAIWEDNDYVFLVTCAHVVDFTEKNSSTVITEKWKKISIDYNTRMGTEKITCHVVFVDKEKDVALLVTEDAMLNYKDNGYTVMRSFAQSKYVRPGDLAYVTGYPNGWGPFLTKGAVNVRNFTLDGDDYHVRNLMLDATISPGNSGGGAYVLYKGKPMLAGMAQHGFRDLENTYGFVLMADIRAAFHKNRYGWLLLNIKKVE